MATTTESYGAATAAPAIAVRNLSKTFRGGRRALKQVSLTVRRGEMVALIGPSGSGKSTLLRHLSGLLSGDSVEKGCSVHIGERQVIADGRVCRDVRDVRASIGFVFQQFNLVSRLSVLTNVLCGALGRTPTWRTLLGLFPAEERDAALMALVRVGIGEQAWQRAGTMSGGQQQRAAIARALVQRADIVLADEPIASLDPNSARRVMDALADVNRDGITVLVSLHQIDYALRYCPRTIALADGAVVYDGPSEALSAERLQEIYGTGAHEVLTGSAEEAAPAAWRPALAAT